MTKTTKTTIMTAPLGPDDPPPTGRARARLQRAMTMAALAAVLALGGVFGLHPRIAEATPRTLPAVVGARGAAAAPAAVPDGGARAGGADEAAADEPDDDDGPVPARAGKRVTGKLNLNTATAAELMLLPGIGPAKAERVVAWRKRNGTFRRVVDLRRVKGFGYRTVKRLEPNLDIKGETTLRAGP